MRQNFYTYNKNTLQYEKVDRFVFRLNTANLVAIIFVAVLSGFVVKPSDSFTTVRETVVVKPYDPTEEF